jgi:hypothetical protein
VREAATTDANRQAVRPTAWRPRAGGKRASCRPPITPYKEKIRGTSRTARFPRQAAPGSLRRAHALHRRGSSCDRAVGDGLAPIARACATRPGASCVAAAQLGPDRVRTTRVRRCAGPEPLTMRIVRRARDRTHAHDREHRAERRLAPGPVESSGLNSFPERVGPRWSSGLRCASFDGPGVEPCADGSGEARHGVREGKRPVPQLRRGPADVGRASLNEALERSPNESRGPSR